MKAEKCAQCGGWAEPPFKSKISWCAPASVEDVPRFIQGEECHIIRIHRPLCHYCVYAVLHGVDGLTEEGKVALDSAKEG